jgi:hypothetical protein
MHGVQTAEFTLPTQNAGRRAIFSVARRRVQRIVAKRRLAPRGPQARWHAVQRDAIDYEPGTLEEIPTVHDVRFLGW